MEMVAQAGEFQGAVAIILGVLLAIWMVTVFVTLARRFIRCPPGKALVVTGRTETGRPQIVTNGAVFVWPMFQEYSFLDLHPFTVGVECERTPYKVTATVAVGTSPEFLEKAAQRLLAQEPKAVQADVQKMIRGHMLQVLASFGETHRVDLVADSLRAAVAPALAGLGLELIDLTTAT